jgi:competence protein ComEC
METKFRAFQLDTDGSLFSYFKPGTYTLIEARIPKGGIQVLKSDLKLHGKDKIDVLHITSWDNDHCNYDDLVQILNNFRPETIEIPHYTPDTDTGKLSLKIITKYYEIHEYYKPNIRIISPTFIKSLPNAKSKGTGDVVYSSKENTDKKNDMSLIKLFRSAGFNVISLGDCECSTIANTLMTYSFITTEVDVLILPHHGADNGFITSAFLDKVKPKIAICSSNYGNQYEHPKQSIRDLLYEKGIPLYTTKTGDVHVIHKKGETITNVFNMMSDNTNVSSKNSFTPKIYQV